MLPQIELRPLEGLAPYARNARTHSPDQIASLKASLLEFGWTNAVLADSEGIVAGHGRVMAAGELYREGRTIRFPNGTEIPLGMVPVVDCSGWNPSQRRAYILADNQLALMAGWDEELLRGELVDLGAAGFDLAVAGFDAAEWLGVASEDAPQVDPEAVPELPVEPVSRVGDVWACGEHLLACADSLDPRTWERLMGEDRADLVVTDPPYNVNYEGRAGSMANDDMADADFRRFLRSAFGAVASVMKPGAPIYVAHADGGPGEAFRASFREAGFKLSGCLIWRKNQFTLSRSDYQWQHEPILYGWLPGARHRWYGGRKRTTVVELGEGGAIRRLEDGRWAVVSGESVLIVPADAELEELPGTVIHCDKPARSDEHPTCKPLALWERLMRPSSQRGDLVVDPFSGSGTTLVAAERLGLRARVSELDPRYADVAVRRWQMLTGRRAFHANTGAQFPEIAA